MSPMVLVAAFAFIITLIALPVMMRLAVSWDLVDHPIHRKNHAHPIPYLGGVAVFFGITLALVVLYPWYGKSLSGAELNKLLTVMTAGIGAMLFGFIDDKFQIRARYKLAWQIFITAAFAIFAYRFKSLHIPGTDPISLEPFEIIFTVGWMLTIVNGMNLIDGIDGLAGSVAVSIFMMLALNSTVFGDPANRVLAFAAIGACGAFLLLNWKPAKIYLGDAGSTGIGMLIAAMLVSFGTPGQPALFNREVGSSQPFLFQIPFVTMIAIYPILEVTLSVFRRVIRGKSIGTADRGHIHHKLMDMGWSAAGICLVAAMLTTVSGAVPWTMVGHSKGAAAWLMLAVGGTVGLLLHFCGYLRALHPERIRETRPHFQIANHFASIQRIRLSLARSLEEVLELLNQTCLEFGVESYKITLDPKLGRGIQNYEWKRLPSHVVQSSLRLVTLRFDAGEAPVIDRVALQESRSAATWFFAQREISEALDIEHRVLLNEFVKAALRRIEDFQLSVAQGKSVELAMRIDS